MLDKLARASFLLMVFSLPFANVPGLRLFGMKAQPTEYVFPLAVAGMAALWISRKQKLRFGIFHLLVASYVAAIGISVIFSGNPSVSAVKFAGICYLAGLALVSYGVVKNIGEVRWFLLAWLLATVVTVSISLLTLVLFYFDPADPVVGYSLSHYGTFPPGNYPRIQSTFANPNMLCHYLSISWVALIAAYRMEWIKGGAAVIIGILTGIAAFFTLSPGLGAFFLSTGLWIFFNEKGGRAFRTTALALGLVAAAMFVAVTAVKFEKDLTISPEPSARVLTWKSAAGNLLAHPLTGKGVGTLAADVNYEQQRLRDAHNLFLNVGAESGLLGLMSISLLGFWIIRRGFDTKGKRGAERMLSTALAMAFLGGFLYQGLTGSFEDARHLWVLVGVSAAVSGKNFGERPDE